MINTRILVAEDDDRIRAATSGALTGAGHEVVQARDSTECLAKFQSTRPDITLLDCFLGDGTALDIIPKLKGIYPAPVFVITGQGTIDLAVRSMHLGADQFLTKPVEYRSLLSLIDKTLEKERLKRTHDVHWAARRRRRLDPFLGISKSIQQLAEDARKFINYDIPILIYGETGTGKSVLAAWLHENSFRREEAFVDINCACLSKDLLESELFGHEKGAFTGAVTAKAGLLEMAHKGVAFLDEIGDMDAGVQPKLLKFVEDGVFRRLGSVRDIRADLRLICATHQNVQSLVAAGRFRLDLFFRISTACLRIPALRERREDIPLFVRHFINELRQELAGPKLEITDSALHALQVHDWPGNVRELRNVLERAAIVADHNTIDLEHLVFQLGSFLTGRTSEDKASGPEDISLKQMEAAHIAKVLEMSGGSVERAALQLRIAKTTLYYKIKAHGIKNRSEKPIPVC
ncbi:MAG: sigma-54 dependent transcriptional regulator [Candidatus Korobacteraceae bacterium]